MMRTIILCMALVAVASESSAQKDLEKERVTLRFTNARAENVVRMVATSLGYEPLIEDSLRSRPVTIRVEDVTAQAALSTICESLGTTWHKVGKMLVVGEVAFSTGGFNDKGLAKIEAMKKSGRRGDDWWKVASLDEELGEDITWFYMPLSEAVSMLGRAYSATADVPPELAKRKVSTSIKSLTLRQALDAVCAAADCRWEIEELPPVHDPPAPPYPSRVIHVRDRRGR